jgi:hypothetical protein
MPVPKPKHTPTFVPLMTPGPALDGMWPPEKHRGPYHVGRDPSINWQLLAWSWGVDVWDLIWFNFRTDDPRETNWYMHHYLGCWRSNDGKNFSFRDADPGIVYMPPLRYKSLATVVADEISAKAAHYPYVAYKHVHISRTWLLSVIRHIRARRIKVRVATLRKDELAVYARDLNMIVLNESAPPKGTNTDLTLVHEATHAIFDLQKASFPRWEHELIAYLAEALCKISGGFRELTTDTQERAAALARHIIADKAGRPFIRLDDYVDVAAFKNLKSEIIKTHPGWNQVIRGDGVRRLRRESSGSTSG